MTPVEFNHITHSARNEQELSPLTQKLAKEGSHGAVHQRRRKEHQGDDSAADAGAGAEADASSSISAEESKKVD